MMTVTSIDIGRLETMKKQLTAIGSKEYNFIKAELLFYEALEFSRTYGEDMETNELLAALKRVQANEYAHTKELFRKSIQREKVIRQFINAFKSALSAASKKPAAFMQQTNAKEQHKNTL